MRRTAAAVAVLGLLLGAAPASATTTDDVRVETLTVAGTPEADGAPVDLDASLYVPATATADRPAPAVLVAHGFGGSKDQVADEARALAEHGYVALAFTARGFGRSGGLIHLSDPDYEIADGSRLVDALTARPEVAKDARTDPTVGVVGGSYGGAFALMLAALDDRVDAVVPSITWHDLRAGLVPQQAVRGPQGSPADVTPVGTPGVFKRLWAGVFFGSGSRGSGTACGRFAPDLCAAYAAVARSGVADAGILDRLARSSPAPHLASLRAPTLLFQGEQDSLFPLSEADANAAAIAATGTPVSVVWFAGGHDGQGEGDAASSERITELTLAWLDRYLRGDRDAALPAGFEVTVPDAAVSATDSEPAPVVRRWPGLPGVTGPDLAAPQRVPLSGDEQTIVSPPGGTPAALSSLPGLGAVLGAVGSTALPAPAGQSATFTSAPLERATSVVGSPRVRLRVTSSTGDATLFAAVHVRTAGGRDTLPQRLVAPVRLTGIPADGTTVTVALPAVVVDVPAGAQLAVVVTSTDQAYALPADARTYTVALDPGAALEIPRFAERAEPVATGLPLLTLLGGVLGGAAVLGLAAALWARRRRRRQAAAGPDRPDLADVPLAVEGLGKAYGDGYRAVSDLTFRVEPGQVLGLLGPNGAGKTTTLRMALGLIDPTEGEVYVFGRRIVPGAPVLARVGAFVEGPGVLPHLSGIENLRLYWAATGRPLADAHLDAALEVAGLGDPDDAASDVRRRVRNYSQGMRQRLAIAQAMLGLPDLLVLDEPTNGLDPPQIREMRDVLRRYAASGRTVVVSSHLLSEVEQTCTHVVVMRSGRLVAQGEVADLVGEATTLVVDVDDPGRAAGLAASVEGVDDVRTTTTGLLLRARPDARPALVAALVAGGVGVDRVAPQRGLEEAFLALVGEPDA